MSQIWTNLVELENTNKQQILMLSTVEKMIDDMFDLHLPHHDVWEALEDLKLNFPKVDIARFSCYWRAKANAAINIGKESKEVFNIIQKGKEMNAQPPEMLTELFDQVLLRYKNEPDLLDGKMQDDPDLTIKIGLFVILRRVSFY